MHQACRFATVALAAAVLAACGKSQDAANDLPLSYAPADTPYAYANLEPAPQAVLDQSSRQMGALWSTAFGMYDRMLQRAGKLDERSTKILSAVLEEVRDRNSVDKLREIGFKPDAHIAIYGVGLVPVLRLELSDPAAFKAMIARIETKAGEKLPTATTGTQEYWHIDLDKVAAVFAVQNSHLVATLVPDGASDAVKQALLGLVKPTKNLADAGALQALAKQYNYSPYGAGYIDWVALVQRLSSAPTGIDLEIAKAAGLPLEGAITDPVCKAEFLGLAQKVPRFVAGTEALAVGKAKIGFQVEFESTLAAQIMGALSAAPGTAGPGQGLFDFSLALPVLKVKDFWLKQADAVAAKPFACSQLAQLNEAFRDVKAKFDTTIPPPFSDLTGMRISITKVEPKGAGSVPDVAGKLLIGSSNPLAALGMAQMASPQLKDLKIAADGKPVALPAGLIPAQVPPMSVAMSDKALALSAGAGEDASLGAYLAAPSATTPVFARSYITGAIYGVLLRYVDVAMAAMPAEQREDFGANSKAFALYEKLIRSADITFEANASGIGIHETVETNPID